MNFQRREDLADGIRRRAHLIDRDMREPQNIRILCPHKEGGLYCQWVAGHYGDCVGSRYGPQQRLL